MYSTKVEKKGFIEMVLFKLGVKRQVVQPTRWCTQEWKKGRTKRQKAGFSSRENIISISKENLTMVEI